MFDPANPDLVDPADPARVRRVNALRLLVAAEAAAEAVEADDPAAVAAANAALEGAEALFRATFDELTQRALENQLNNWNAADNVFAFETEGALQDAIDAADEAVREGWV